MSRQVVRVLFVQVVSVGRIYCRWLIILIDPLVPVLLQSGECEDPQRRVLFAARTVLCARLSRVVLNASTRQTCSDEDVASRQDGQGDQYRSADQLRNRASVVRG